MNDEQDLAAALSTIERGRAALVYAHSLTPAQATREQRRAARQAASGIVALAVRFLEEIVDRNNGKAGA